MSVIAKAIADRQSEIERLQAEIQEPAAPLGDGRTRHVKLRPHGSCGNTISEEQHDLGTLDASGGQGVGASAFSRRGNTDRRS